MSFWKNLFGISAPHTTGDDENRRVSALVEKAQKFYPHKNPTKALALFREAISLMEPAPASKRAQKDRDNTSIGSAFWMAWVCLDLLDKAEETEALLAEARIKSPATAERIEERLVESKKEAQGEQKLEEALSILKATNPHEQSQAHDAISTLEHAGAWWNLRDAGIVITKTGNHELAWQALSAALAIATSKTGNVPSVYVAMGDVRKAQQRHREAARLYLLSCLSADSEPSKRAVDQIRISLKKAGVLGDAATIRDELLTISKRKNNQAVLDCFDNYFPSEVVGQ